MNQWEVVIGIETHAQLATVSKIFSGAATAFGAEPNTQACAVDLALPGVLPVLNRKAVECAIRFGLAIGAEVFRTVIPSNVRLAEAPSYGLPIRAHDRNSKGNLAYLALAGEMLNRYEAKQA